MFILYINDLPNHVSGTTRCRLFADDCLLYRIINSTQDQIQLQNDLTNLESWAVDWGMVFNPSKCFVMPINRGISHQPYFYQLCGVVLQAVEQEKYLGVIISHNLSWSSHINVVATKANQKLGFLKRNPSRAKTSSLHQLCAFRSGICLLGVGPPSEAGEGLVREGSKESSPVDHIYVRSGNQRNRPSQGTPTGTS